MPTPIHVFFQPIRNLRMLADLGVTHFWGPEVENARGMAPAALAAAQQAWIDAVAAVGGKCVLKNPPVVLPAHCVGVLTTVDEPNGKGVLPATVRAEAEQLRARYFGTPIYLSLAGDKVTSANLRKPAELQLLADYLACADVVSVDCYSMNRNASRYRVRWTADAVKTVKAVRPDVKVLAWAEVNDQRLPAPTSQTVPGVPDVNREPTPQEIDDTVATAILEGADAVGWFATCDSGKYGWPDSYWPLVNRTGASMTPQYAKLGELARRLNGGVVPPPPPVPETPPPPPPVPPVDLSQYVKRADVERLVAELFQDQQLKFYDTQLSPLRDHVDLLDRRIKAVLKNLGEAVAEGA